MRWLPDEAERNFLSAIKTPEHLQQAVSTGVTPECFTVDFHRKLYQRMIKHRGPLGERDLALAGFNPEIGAIDVQYWQEQVLDGFLRRSLLEALGEAVTTVEDNPQTTLNRLSIVLSRLKETANWDGWLADVHDTLSPGPPEWVWGRLLPKGLASIMYGKGGAGKSYLAMCLAIAWASGEPFLGEAVHRGRVLYLDMELTKDLFLYRYHSLLNNFQLDGEVLSLSYWNATGKSLLEIQDELRDRLSHNRIDYLIVDSLGAAMGTEKKQIEAATPVFNMLRMLSPVTTLLIDHPPKNTKMGSSPFGSAYKQYLSRSVFLVQQLNHDDNHILLQISQDKANIGPYNKPIGASIEFVDGGSIVKVNRTEVPSNIDEDEPLILSMLRVEGPKAARQLAEMTGRPIKVVWNDLERMTKRGDIYRLNERDNKGNILYAVRNNVIRSVPAAHEELEEL